MDSTSLEEGLDTRRWEGIKCPGQVELLFAGNPQKDYCVCASIPCFSLWIPELRQNLTKNSTKFLLTRSPTKVLTFFLPPYHMWVVTQESGGEHSEPIIGKRRTSECRLRPQ